jgi:hypothetical protein
MKETDADDIYFREIMAKSKLEVPFSDFDDKVMGLIEKKLLEKKSISRDIKLSWFFFIFGAASGIMVSVFLSHSDVALFGISLDNLTMPFVIVFAAALMTQLDTFKEFYRKRVKS